LESESYNINRNLRSKARDALAAFVNGLSISDISSVRTQLGMLSMMTSQTDEISRNTQVKQESLKSICLRN
jgi:hypothetical protein